MLFGERELKDYAEPVEAAALNVNRIYFSLQFLDAAMLIPILEPLVFVGRDLLTGDQGRLYFQTYESHCHGLRFDSTDNRQRKHFQILLPANLNHIFEFERALNLLLTCSLKRSQIARCGGEGV